PRRVEIRGLDDLSVSGFAACRLDVRILQAEDRGHRTLPDRNCRLHGLAAKSNEVDGRAEVEHFCTNERRVLAETVSGHRRRKAAAVLPPNAPRRDPCGEHRGLRALGRTELLLRPLLAKLPEVVAEHLGG